LGQSKGIAPATDSKSEPELKAADKLEAAMPLQIMMPSADDHHPMRLVLIVLAAAAITLIVLLWLVTYIPRNAEF
jgi:hypothetical protein